MKNIFFFFLSFLFHSALAQKNIDGLVQTEKSFASMALEQNVKDAFLFFMDSSAIVFDKGKPVHAIALWTNRKADSSVLKWHPVYAEIADSNDFGYTTGPWTLQLNTESDSITARGQFTTIWHISPNGTWKFLVDIGTRHQEKDTSVSLMQIKRPKTKSKGKASLMNAEQMFKNAAEQNAASAYTKYLSVESILNHNGYLPAVQPFDQQKIIAALPAQILYKPAGSAFATSGDLGYVYGTAWVNAKGKAYLHIWRHEKNGWKLAAEVLHY